MQGSITPMYCDLIYGLEVYLESMTCVWKLTSY